MTTKNVIPIQERITLTVAEAAQLLGWKRQRLDEFIACGKLATLDMSGIKRIARKELDRFIESLSS